MTIPHIAIVGGCLLAGNNPNTLEAIVSGLRLNENHDAVDDETKRRFLRRIAHGLKQSYTHFYTSIYQYAPQCSVLNGEVSVQRQQCHRP